jgi:hypothetical protein
VALDVDGLGAGLVEAAGEARGPGPALADLDRRPARFSPKWLPISKQRK